MPLWWRSDRPEQVTVRALHDGKEVAILMVWQDDTNDQTALRPQDFRDAAAIQFSLTANPPFFAMGATGAPVNIWMWKSERQADLDVAYQDVERAYPNIGMDSYPNSMRSAVEQPSRHALTLQSDPTFVTGWGAGNIVSDPQRKSAVEDLAAQDSAHCEQDRGSNKIDARGVYGQGSYEVMFRRTLTTTGEGAVALRPGSTVPSPCRLERQRGRSRRQEIGNDLAGSEDCEMNTVPFVQNVPAVQPLLTSPATRGRRWGLERWNDWNDLNAATIGARKMATLKPEDGKVTRRDFLKWMGIGTGAAVIAAGSLHYFSPADAGDNPWPDR
jgi:hypothetical protein